MEPLDLESPAPRPTGPNGARLSQDEPPPGFFDDPGEGQATRSTIVLLDGPALAAPLPELDYLVREIDLVAGGGAPHLVAGYGFTGKTLALQAMAVARGFPRR